jgi:hypothetical protein
MQNPNLKGVKNDLLRRRKNANVNRDELIGEEEVILGFIKSVRKP